MNFQSLKANFLYSNTACIIKVVIQYRWGFLFLFRLLDNKQAFLFKKREKRGRINCIGDFYRLILSALHWSFDSSLSGCTIGNIAKRLSSNSSVSYSNQMKALNDLI